MDALSKVKEALEDVAYEISEHEPVISSEEAAEIRGHGDESRGAKAMVVRSEGRFFMFVLPGDRKMDFGKIRDILGSDSVSLADPEEVEDVTGCKVGGVPPFGTVFGLKTYVDPSLLDNEEIDFNAGKRTVSITMDVDDWKEIVEPEVKEFVR